MNIVEACHDPAILREFFGSDFESYAGWMTALKVVYGLPVKTRAERELVQQCTGRDPERMPAEGFKRVLFLCGRRSGKSRAAACIAAFEANLASDKLPNGKPRIAAGDQGVVCVCAPKREISGKVLGYLKYIFGMPGWACDVAEQTKESFLLKTDTLVTVLTGSSRGVRSATILCAVVDEAAWFWSEESGQARSDSELIAALEPALITAQGRLIAITSPHRRAGWCYKTFSQHWGREGSDTLVWKAPSRVMNPSLPQEVIDRALAEDPQRARSEYLADWRDDLAAFASRELVEAAVIRGRDSLPPVKGRRYWAFCDLSGGRHDSGAIAVAHKDKGKVVIDLLKEYKPPFSPQEVVGRMCAELKRYGLREVVGDQYGAEFTSSSFASRGVRYKPANKSKSQLYLEMLPRLASGELELPDEEKLIAQLGGLERRARSGARDSIDSAPGGHDDLANVVAGVCDGNKLVTVGVLEDDEDDVESRAERMSDWLDSLDGLTITERGY